MELDRSSEIPSALLAGRLEGISLPDLLWALCRCHSTGVLRVTGGESEKSVYVRDGRIVFAASSDPDDRLGELFLRGGIVTLDQLEDVLGRLHTGKRLGTLLVEAGALTPEELIQGVLTQVESIVLGLFDWEEGDYRFDEGPLPTAEVITLNMKTSELLMRGIRQLQSFSRIRRSVGATQKTYGLREGWAELLDGVVLTAGEESLVERLGEGDASLDELCREVFLSNFEVYQVVWGLKVLGVIEERDEPWMAPSDVMQKGSLATVDFSELLVSLARGGETGVLYVTRGEHERSFHISGGRCVFATSNDPDDGLLAYLLRRGVISLRDREETAKRLLSNKRVGTILREMGVIDEHDLREMVREQLSEIVYDTFRWTDAMYAFASGPLPSVEEITLEMDLDALVARGIKRVASWSRVWQGCGGLEVTLALKPTYLSVLDAMGAGPDEWQVIAALKSPHTPRDICRKLSLGSFRACQILWTMRVLGGLEAVAADEAEAVPVGEIEAVGVDQPEEPESAVTPATRDDEPADAFVADDDASRVDAVETEGIEIPVEQAAAEAVEPLSDAEPDVEPETIPQRYDVPAELDEPQFFAEEAGVAEASPDATQVLSREVVDAAMQDPQVDAFSDIDPGSPDATQMIPRDVIEAAVAGQRAGPPDPPAPADEPLGSGDQPEGSTVELERDDVDSALQSEQPPEPAAVSPPIEETPWNAPETADRAMARFNAAQRVVYRIVRAEVGAGAANFIRSCCAQGFAEDADPVAGVELQADGSWDTAGLLRVMQAQRVEDPWTLYQQLIDREIDWLRELVGEVRAAEVRKQVEQVEQVEQVDAQF